MYENLHSLLRINKRYKAGTTNNDIKVDTISPEIMVHANGGHSVLLVMTNGNKPATVVIVVNNMGRARLLTAKIMDWSKSMSLSKFFWIKSNNTMALLTTMPTNAKTPSMAVNPKVVLVINKPIGTPANANGIVMRIINTFKNELKTN